MLPRLMNPVGQNISQATVHKTSYGINSEFTELCSFVLAGLCAPVRVSSLLCPSFSIGLTDTGGAHPHMHTFLSVPLCSAIILG